MIQGYDGFCGDDVYYSFDSSTKTLRIFGTGDMGDGYRPWSSYSADITSVTIGNGVTRIGGLAFNGCTGLTGIEIPACVTSIGARAFENSGLTAIEIPAGVTSIEENTFIGCTSLTNVVIPASVTSIGDYAFSGCRALTSIVIPAGVTSIGNFAFGNSGLTAVEIPASVKRIGFGAFGMCGSLVDVTIYAPALEEYGEMAFAYNAPGRKIYVFSEYLNDYKAQASRMEVSEDDILPIEQLDVAANLADGNYWTTFYCGLSGFKIDEGENAWAYTAEYDAVHSQLTLHKLGKVIPKNTAVILVGDDNSISMTASSEAAQNSVANNLHGVDIRTAKSALGSGTFYVMGKQGGNFGFFEYTADYMPARKAYLRIDGGAAQARGLTMVFDETTSVSEELRVKSEEFAPATEWYTLDGRKLDGKPTTKGLYIHNGRKIIIK